MLIKPFETQPGDFPIFDKRIFGCIFAKKKTRFQTVGGFGKAGRAEETEKLEGVNKLGQKKCLELKLFWT